MLLRKTRLPARRCLARRYFGPREWTGAQWADFVARLPPRLRELPRVGFTYDDPRVTPPERIRHDPAVEVRDGFAPPEALGESGFDLLESPAGLWAMVDGPARDTMAGYRAIFDGWFQGRPDYAMEGDPYLERYGVSSNGEHLVTVCVRVRPIVQKGDFNMTVVELDAVTPSGTAP